MKKFNAETTRKLEELRTELNKWHNYNHTWQYSNGIIPTLYKACSQSWCKDNIIKNNK